MIRAQDHASAVRRPRNTSVTFQVPAKDTGCPADIRKRSIKRKSPACYRRAFAAHFAFRRKIIIALRLLFIKYFPPARGPGQKG